MDFIRKHKLTTFIILVYTILIIFLFFIYNMFIGSSGMPVYGDRLDGIEEVPITEEQYTKIMTDLNSESSVVAVEEPSLNGKILQVVITVGDTTQTNTAKSLAEKVTATLTEEQKNFYDVQVFITKDYHCTLEATGQMDEEGNFIENVTVKFENDPSKNDHVSNYGISNKETVDYNNNQEYEITEDGTYVIYGYTKDKVGESKCSIKIVKKEGATSATEQTIKSSLNESFPIIGYRRKATDSFVWTKDR